VHGRDGTSRTAALLIWLRSLCLVASRERASERERERERASAETKNSSASTTRSREGRGKSRDGALVLQGTDLQTKHTYCHGCFKRFISAQEESNSQA
jgi:hypothetical protein